jgi:hydroxymethylbilane synthase
MRIGTRGSPLALWQANFVAEGLRPYAETVLVEIETTGDQARDKPLAAIGGEGLFTKEIQNALLERRIDVAVHSLKDLPTQPVPGLTLAAVPPRGPTGDVFVSRRHPGFNALPRGAVVATGSLRRRAQVLHCRPDLQIVSIRGNVETRLRKLHEQELDAIILAQAGLERLGLMAAPGSPAGRSLMDTFVGAVPPSSLSYAPGEVILEVLDPAWMLPAVGQGALGLECRAEDAEVIALLEWLNDSATRQAVLAERACLRALGGGCLVPIGAAATVENQALTVRGCVLDPDGRRRVDGEVAGPAHEPEDLGQQLASQLEGRGARELLARPG